MTVFVVYDESPPVKETGMVESWWSFTELAGFLDNIKVPLMKSVVILTNVTVKILSNGKNQHLEDRMSSTAGETHDHKGKMLQNHAQAKDLGEEQTRTQQAQNRPNQQTLI